MAQQRLAKLIPLGRVHDAIRKTSPQRIARQRVLARQSKVHARSVTRNVRQKVGRTNVGKEPNDGFWHGHAGI